MTLMLSCLARSTMALRLRADTLLATSAAYFLHETTSRTAHEASHLPEPVNVSSCGGYTSTAVAAVCPSFVYPCCPGLPDLCARFMLSAHPSPPVFLALAVPQRQQHALPCVIATRVQPRVLVPVPLLAVSAA